MNRSETTSKPLLIMLAPHEHPGDPRVDWEATAAADRYEVFVLCLHDKQRTRADEEAAGKYRIRRLADAGAGDVARVLAGLAPTLAETRWDRVVQAGFLIAGGGFLILFALALWTLQITRRVLVAALRPTPWWELMIPIRNFSRSIQNRCERSRWFRLVHFTINARAMILIAAQLDRGVRETPTPVLVHCNDVFALLPGILHKRRTGCPVVYDSHEYWPEGDVLAARFEQRFIFWFEGKLARKADAVVTVSPPLAELIRAEYRLPEVQTVLNAEPWLPENSAFRESRDRAPAALPVRFLFQGRFAPERGILELIRAWRHIPAAQAVLWLRGPDDIYCREAKNLAAELGLLERGVQFLAPVTEDELVAAAAEADVGIIPYKPITRLYQFSCPNKLSQYMHAGLPILSNELTYVRAVLEEADCGLVYNSQDEQSIVREVLAFAEDAALRRRLAANALKFAQTTFNWQVQGQVLLEIYDRLTARAGPAARPKPPSARPQPVPLSGNRI